MNIEEFRNHCLAIKDAEEYTIAQLNGDF